MDKVDFLFTKKYQSFLQAIGIAFGGRGHVCRKYPPPKNKFVISLKYFKKKVKDKYDILHEDKHQSFVQAGSIAFTGHSQACPKYSKFVISLQYL